MENTARTLPDFAGITLEKILESANLNAALKKVESNQGAPGVDGMRTDELRQYITDHPGELRRVLLDGTYRPKPVKRVTIPTFLKSKGWTWLALSYRPFEWK